MPDLARAGLRSRGEQTDIGCQSLPAVRLDGPRGVIASAAAPEFECALAGHRDLRHIRIFDQRVGYLADIGLRWVICYPEFQESAYAWIVALAGESVG